MSASIENSTLKKLAEGGEMVAYFLVLLSSGRAFNLKPRNSFIRSGWRILCQPSGERFRRSTEEVAIKLDSVDLGGLGLLFCGGGC
jgi:hypothetical protein